MFIAPNSQSSLHSETLWQHIQQQNYLQNPLITDTINTPLGDMLAVFSVQGLCLLEFVNQAKVAQELAAVQKARQGFCVQAALDDERMTQLRTQIHDYFQGSLHTFSIALDMIGTPFQQRAWQQLQTIAYGTTISYAQQAAQIGQASAVRAVAAANGNNKISIIVPCHRVIGSNGKLTGYAGGLARKQFLLDLEQNRARLL